MTKDFNVVIPSITTDFRLIRCLNGLQKIKNKQFFVTLVLENNLNIQKLRRFKFKINILINKNKINMSAKRNIAVNKFKSKYIAFIDSDAYPDIRWLDNGLKLFKKGFKVFGGPNIPFSNQSYLQKISYFCKRSFFVTAHYNFVKYKSFDTYCDWLDSSNFMIKRSFYKSINGMDESLYIGEDHDFFYRLKNKYKKLKIFFSKDVFVYHEDRELHLYCLQRFVYGLNVFAANNTIEKRLIALIPAVTILLITIGFFIFNSKEYLIFLLISFLVINIFIFFNISKYIEKINDKLFTVLGIYAANLFYGMGSLFTIFGFRKRLEKKIYRNIKNEK